MWVRGWGGSGSRQLSSQTKLQTITDLDKEHSRHQDTALFFCVIIQATRQSRSNITGIKIYLTLVIIVHVVMFCGAVSPGISTKHQTVTCSFMIHYYDDENPQNMPYWTFVIIDCILGWTTRLHCPEIWTLSLPHPQTWRRSALSPVLQPPGGDQDASLLGKPLCRPSLYIEL